MLNEAVIIEMTLNSISNVLSCPKMYGVGVGTGVVMLEYIVVTTGGPIVAIGSRTLQQSKSKVGDAILCHSIVISCCVSYANQGFK